MKKNALNTARFLFAIAAIILASCTADYEPCSQSIKQTRGAADVAYTYTAQEAQQIANAKLRKSAFSGINAKVEPIKAKNKQNHDLLLSDTVAYVINYNNNGGFAIIANDSRIDPVLAYGNKGEFSEKNIVAKEMFLDKIEGYLANLSKTNISESKQNTSSLNSPTRRIVIDPQITIELGPEEPFDRLVKKDHPKCNAGLVNVSAANIISHTLKQLTYNNYFYDFKSINYALNQGEGFYPINPDIIKPLGNMTNDIPMQFIYSYNGSVSAFNQLLYDIGKSSHTIYPASGTTMTMPWNLVPVFEDMGLIVSEISNDHDINNIVSLLFNGYLVNMSCVYVKNEGGYIDIDMLHGPQAFVIDGCNVILNNENKVESGEVHCVWGYYDVGVGYYSYPVLISNDYMHTALLQHFGVKANE